MEKEWIMGCWVLVGILMGSFFWLRKESKRRMKKSKSLKGEIPKGNLGWPLIGETLDFIACGYTSRPVSFMEKRRSLYGEVFKTNILGTPIIVSTDADVNKVVLQNQGNSFIPAYPKSVKELMGQNSILQINGSLHKKLHGLIGGFLKSPQFKARITTGIENSVKLNLARWGRIQSPIYVQNEAQQITFEVLVKVLMSLGPGEDLNLLKKEFEEFIKGLICIPIKFPGTRLYKSLKARERLLKMVGRIVQEKRKANSTQQPGPVNDAMDVLLREDGDPTQTQRLPLDFITGNIIEMMIPGEETVPMVMTLAVKFLGDSRVALDKLTEENMELKRHKVDSSENYAWTDYMSLPFTQNVRSFMSMRPLSFFFFLISSKVISETLRMANIINAVWRKALKDVEIKGYLIPKGWGVMASFSSVHMDEKNYENPYQFDPWRWERNSEPAVNCNTNFTPFGGGQRLCPGLELSRLELSIFLHHLVTNYSWVAEKDDIVHFPTVKMKRKLPITVTSTSTLKI